MFHYQFIDHSTGHVIDQHYSEKELPKSYDTVKLGVHSYTTEYRVLSITTTGTNIDPLVTVEVRVEPIPFEEKLTIIHETLVYLDDNTLLGAKYYDINEPPTIGETIDLNGQTYTITDTTVYKEEYANGLISCVQEHRTLIRYIRFTVKPKVKQEHHCNLYVQPTNECIHAGIYDEVFKLGDIITIDEQDYIISDNGTLRWGEQMKNKMVNCWSFDVHLKDTLVLQGWQCPGCKVFHHPDTKICECAIC